MVFSNKIIISKRELKSIQIRWNNTQRDKERKTYKADRETNEQQEKNRTTNMQTKRTQLDVKL